MISENFLQTDILVRSNGPGSLGDNFLPFLPDLTTNKLANMSKSKLKQVTGALPCKMINQLKHRILVLHRKYGT